MPPGDEGSLGFRQYRDRYTRGKSPSWRDSVRTDSLFAAYSSRNGVLVSGTSIHRILKKHGSVVFPGVYDTLSVKLAEGAGFPMAFVSGYAVSATAIGEPDMGLLTQTEITERARAVCAATTMPIIVDADTGYGNPMNVLRTVNDLIAAGAAGCFLEDQIWPKRCGHIRNKRVIDRDEYIQKIRAAVEARDGRDFFIVARTDAEAAADLDEAFVRMELARDAGADASFVEAPGSVAQLAEIGKRAPRPIVANMIEGGKTPLLTKSELSDLGFDLILYPLTGLYTAAEAWRKAYQHLAAHGTSSDHGHELIAFDRFNELMDLDTRIQMSHRFGTE